MSNQVDRIFEAADFPRDHPEYDKLYRLISSDMAELMARCSVLYGLSYERVRMVQKQEEIFIEDLKGIKERRWPKEDGDE